VFNRQIAKHRVLIPTVFTQREKNHPATVCHAQTLIKYLIAPAQQTGPDQRPKDNKVKKYASEKVCHSDSDFVVRLPTC
jgi:hypothetical protein